MRLLVTGGAGYIGSVVVTQLADAGHQVVVFDRLSQGHRKAVDPRAELIVGDLADRAAVEDAMAAHRPEGILHFASHTLVGESMERPFLHLGENVRNGLNLLESAVEHGVRRFILSSTANLFGVPDAIPIPADAAIRPGSPYGESKHILERLLHWMDDRFAMRYASLRYFNAAGAVSPDRGEDHDPETHLIPVVLQVALGQREAVMIFGDDYDTPDGTCVRDYIHVADLADAHVRALHALDGGSRTYNLGNGRGFSVREVIETARAVTGHPIPARVAPRRPGDPAVLVAESERIRRELGWEPRHGELRDIIASAWAWHRAHPHGYADRSGGSDDSGPASPSSSPSR
ncbi:UDP-glucose 4-epimerase GalE [Longimicrobium sp.]|uniref:UDP-glucose 4-epimerase GalE n=1 Tax=Longimicrobium sp. TaxID=2029185 RepID=UPI002B5B412E|nr:UDP-glucose 4-epimerase GalE [Longimicrobium sp.]HSU17718.1 UDP-glucose 4-epimerase GalE [Longimicrobium sp.]